MWAVKTKCWRRRMFLFPLSPPCEHPVDLLLGLLLLPPLLYYPNSGAQWEYPVVRCELVGNNKQWAAYRSTGGPIRIPDTLLLLLPLLLLLLLQYPNRWAHTETWHCSSASVNSSTIACCSKLYVVSQYPVSSVPVSFQYMSVSNAVRLFANDYPWFITFWFNTICIGLIHYAEVNFGFQVFRFSRLFDSLFQWISKILSFKFKFHDNHIKIGIPSKLDYSIYSWTNWTISFILF